MIWKIGVGTSSNVAIAWQATKSLPSLWTEITSGLGPMLAFRVMIGRRGRGYYNEKRIKIGLTQSAQLPWNQNMSGSVQKTGSGATISPRTRGTFIQKRKDWWKSYPLHRFESRCCLGGYREIGGEQIQYNQPNLHRKPYPNRSHRE